MWATKEELVCTLTLASISLKMMETNVSAGKGFKETDGEPTAQLVYEQTLSAVSEVIDQLCDFIKGGGINFTNADTAPGGSGGYGDGDIFTSKEAVIDRDNLLRDIDSYIDEKLDPSFYTRVRNITAIQLSYMLVLLRDGAEFPIAFDCVNNMSDHECLCMLEYLGEL